MKKFTRFFTIADFVEEEKWLREQHQKGLKLVKFHAPGSYTFEEVEPEDVIYRLDYKNTSVSKEYKQMYQDYGWEYLGSCVGWNYFRKQASLVTKENDGELFSDRESKVSMLEHIIKTRLMPLVVLFFCVIIPNLRRAFDHTTNIIDIVINVLIVVLFVIYVYLITHCTRKLKKLKKELLN